jgi:hypothetical protein
MQDAGGHHSSALFVQWVPFELKGTTWEAEEERYTKHLLDIVDTFAPGQCQGGRLHHCPMLQSAIQHVQRGDCGRDGCHCGVKLRAGLAMAER